MKIPLSSISYKQYKQLIESGQDLNLKFVVNFDGIGGSSLVEASEQLVYVSMKISPFSGAFSIKWL